MALIEKQTKLLITDYKINLLNLLDLEGNILESFNTNSVFKIPVGVCVLSDPNNEKIFIEDYENFEIFVFNSNFELQFQFGDENLK